MSNISEQLSIVQQHIAHSAKIHGRATKDIQLIAVSKTQTAECILEAFYAGQMAFGENYLQEARDKQEVLKSLPIEWHFIGPIQSNKTRDIAEHFQWVHSVDRLKIAIRLSQQRPLNLPPLNICVQVNIDQEPTKSGATIEELPPLLSAINALPQLNLRGLMAIPAPRTDAIAQQAIFQKVADLLKTVQQNHPSLRLDTLSMGMSDDLDAAIAAGATKVRVGSAIFGSRQ
jgi:PLP dependent protein